MIIFNNSSNMCSNLVSLFSVIHVIDICRNESEKEKDYGSTDLKHKDGFLIIVSLFS